MKYNDPNGEFIRLLAWGLAFVTDYISNVINNVSDPGKTAYNNTNRGINGMANCLQVPIYSNNNTVFTAGLDPFSLGLSANVAYTPNNGKTTLYGSVGYGFIGGFSANSGVSQQIGDFNIGGGIGYGCDYWGWYGSAGYKGFGIIYGRTHYGTSYGNNPQILGNYSIFWPGGSFTLQNDFIFNLFGKNVGGDGGDRWRTSAWELSIGNLSLGSNVYTNDPLNQYGDNDYDVNGLNLLGKANRYDKNRNFQWGAWNNGQVYYAPLWFGYKSGNTISRVGYSHPMVQDRTQNLIHRWFGPGRQHYYTNYNNFISGFYGNSGYYNPFSLYY